ncbi:MAG: hypothetical protein U5L04_17170 [Trueperaceae bacterium]|nr:hypothetical protein [Trueperaceae bacterium]
MNRHIRRAQEKSDKKREQGSNRRRGPRKTAPKEKAQAKTKSEKPKAREEQKGSAAAKGATRAGRFAGFLALATAALIVSQAFVSFESFSLVDYGVIAFSYVLLGYFTSLWLLRRSAENAIAITIMGGILLSFGIELSRLLRPDIQAYPLLVFASAPALLIGVLVARFVYKRSPKA